MIRRLRVLLKRLLSRIPYMGIVEFCHDCGRRVRIVWTATDPLWAMVTNRPDGGGVFCPDCFHRRAEEVGLELRWYPTVEAVLEKGGG